MTIEPGARVTMCTDVRTVAVVGAGSIGASWAALALARGLAVVVTDPDPATEVVLRDSVLTRLAELGGSDDAPGLTFTTDLAVAASQADLVLECGPERLDIKRSIFATLDEHTRPDVLLASSSSGLPPSSFQDACADHPDRVVVAHPFNPPHLVPLVEVVGGRLTSDVAVDAAMVIFAALGKRPIRLRQELPGHVVNRLQAALWREAYSLVERGAVSVADIDVAVSCGPGLRWALLGPFATQHLSGGVGGLAHVLEHLGPPMVEWWDDLGSPELSPELVATLVAGMDDEMAGVDQRDVLSRRDEALRELLEVKSRLGLS